MKPLTIGTLIALVTAVAIPSCTRKDEAAQTAVNSDKQKETVELVEQEGACCAADAAKDSNKLGPPPEVTVLVKGEFDLINVKTGKKANKDSFDGSYRLVFFGFTHCRVVCPLGLNLMAGITRELDKQSAVPDLVPLFISIDPDRDAADRLENYLAAYHPRIIGLRGSKEKTWQAMRSFRIEAPRTEVRSETDYQLDHPALIMLMDRQGNYLKSIPSSGDPVDLANELMVAINKDRNAAGTP